MVVVQGARLKVQIEQLLDKDFSIQHLKSNDVLYIV